MNIERFHNELAMRLGYERILKDAITIEEAEDPMVTLRVPGYDEISFKVYEGPDVMGAQVSQELKDIINVVHQAYIATIHGRF